ncbi:DNA-directed RNA polymerase III subunit RPC8 [Punica granatum]|uniref:DNA-directed RNA polymerase subunit n=1 Tax=Punica granatum TaxID=22663 RepID=A0A6P8DAW1_PUNGR|nr:DNA-directed RNA polymerase III subunit RPC8 [Punica granatum]XP_031391705.1 DNA-directed RNA polymerase III subunit RPC8 [Punica granatum]XP_031391706.1 DNA-directed RNA polymerase III subunit RPC8 [Punica granatum]
MFSLSLIEHTLRLPPHLLGLSLEKAVRHELEGLFLDKVIAKLGLCVSVYDIRSINGGFIFPGDGAPTYTVRCRLIMFRPFVGEIIDAKLKDYDENSLRLSLGFFDDICIPPHLLPTPSHFWPDPENGNRRRWVWEYQTDDENQTSGSMFAIDEIGATIRFKVQSISYPSIPLEQPNSSKPFAPMVVTGSIDNDGLGPLSWWE